MASCVLALGLPSDRPTPGRPAHRNLLHAAHRVTPGVFTTGVSTMTSKQSVASKLMPLSVVLPIGPSVPFPPTAMTETAGEPQLALASRMQPGDVLLYRPAGLFGWGIRIKTGGPQSHAELYIGNRQALASRDRQGTGRYPWRLSQLGWVLRPTVPFDRDACLDWFEHQGAGQPYGWSDLLTFFGVPVNGPGVVCSPFVVYALRAAGVPIFGTTPPERIAPNDLPLSELLSDVSASVLGRLDRPVYKSNTSLVSVTE